MHVSNDGGQESILKNADWDCSLPLFFVPQHHSSHADLNEAAAAADAFACD